MSDLWVELHAENHAQLADIYARADELKCESIHHFREPWYPEGAVVRVLLAEGLTLGDFEFDGSIWDASSDENLFGPEWPAVRLFFEGASRVALLRHTRADDYTQWFDRKLVHCALNAWGYEPVDETAFARKMVRDRLRIRWHCWWWSKLHFNRPCKFGCHRPEWSA